MTCLNQRLSYHFFLLSFGREFELRVDTRQFDYNNRLSTICDPTTLCGMSQSLQSLLRGDSCFQNLYGLLAAL